MILMSLIPPAEFISQRAAPKEHKHPNKNPGSNKGFRFFTDPKRDWVPIVVSIAILFRCREKYPERLRKRIGVGVIRTKS